MHWPTDTEWFEIFVIFCLFGLIDIMRDCRKYLKAIAEKQEHKKTA